MQYLFPRVFPLDPGAAARRVAASWDNTPDGLSAGGLIIPGNKVSP